MASNYLHSTNRIRQRTYNPFRVFGVMGAGSLALQGMAMQALRIHQEDAQAFTDRVRETSTLLPLPDFLTHKAIGPRLSRVVTKLFQQSVYKNSGRLESLRPEYFDHLLFAAALLQYKLPKELPQTIIDLLRTPLPIDVLPEKESLVTTYGVESEFFGVYDDTPILDATRYFDKDWLLTTDRSIHPDDFSDGLELVSPVLTSHNIHRLYLFCTLLALNKARASHKNCCALHVHAGINQISDDECRMNLIRQMVVNYASIEDHLDFLNTDMTKHYRDISLQNNVRDNFFFGSSDTKPVRNFMNAALKASEKDLPDTPFKATILQPFERRHTKINLYSLGSYGTAEFRHHPGTTNPVEVMAWVRFVNDFMKASMNMVESQPAHRPRAGEVEHLKNLVETLKKRRVLSTGLPSMDSVPHV